MSETDRLKGCEEMLIHVMDYLEEHYHDVYLEVCANELSVIRKDLEEIKNNSRVG